MNTVRAPVTDSCCEIPFAVATKLSRPLGGEWEPTIYCARQILLASDVSVGVSEPRHDCVLSRNPNALKTMLIAGLMCQIAHDTFYGRSRSVAVRADLDCGLDQSTV